MTNQLIWDILFYFWLFFFTVGMLIGITFLFVIITHSFVKEQEDEVEKSKFEDCGL